MSSNSIDESDGDVQVVNVLCGAGGLALAGACSVWVSTECASKQLALGEVSPFQCGGPPPLLLCRLSTYCTARRSHGWSRSIRTA